MGILALSDIPAMLSGAADYIRDVQRQCVPYVLELLVMAVAQYLYAEFWEAVPNDPDHVRSTSKIVCSCILYKYRYSVQRIIEARNSVAHYIGTDRCKKAITGIEVDLETVLTWLF